MNDIEKILTGGGMVFKKKAQDENTGERKIKYSDFLKGTHKSGSAKMKAEYKYKKALRNTKKEKIIGNYRLSIANYSIFVPELMWIDLYCLQPQEKMLKTRYFL